MEDNEINYDSSAIAYGDVSAETRNAAYSFEIKPDTEYTLTVMFENHDFVYQQKEFTTVDEDMTVYAANYDNNDVLINITKEPFYVSSYYPESFEFEKTDGKQSIFIWSGMKPAALETKIN